MSPAVRPRFPKMFRRGPSVTPTTFRGFWHGPPLGPVRMACLRSYLAQGYRFHLYTYDKVKLPGGVKRMDAAAVLPRSELFHFDNPFTGEPDVGPFSDVFRFRLLNRQGGWWVDVDTMCLSAEIPEIGAAWAQENPEADPTAVGTSQIALTAGSELSAALDSRCWSLSREPLAFREVLGPRLLTTVVSELGLPPSQWGTADTFYPIRWIEAFKLWLPEFRDEVEERTADALFVSLYQSLPRYLGLDVGKLAPEESFIDDICQRYGTAAAGAPRLAAEEVIDGIHRFFGEHEWAIRELETVSGRATLASVGLR